MRRGKVPCLAVRSYRFCYAHHWPVLCDLRLERLLGMLLEELGELIVLLEEQVLCILGISSLIQNNSCINLLEASLPKADSIKGQLAE